MPIDIAASRAEDLRRSLILAPTPDALLERAPLRVNVKTHGAVADWNGTTGTDNTTAINAAIVHANAVGAGIVYVPPGAYKTTNYIKLLDDVHLIGAGYESHIHNASVSGFSKCTIASGNMGDPTGGSSMFDEVGVPIAAVSPGDEAVTVTDGGNAAAFLAGEIVGVASFERWPVEIGDIEKYTNGNQVLSVAGNVISLRYPIPDSYPSASGARPTVRRLTGLVNGYDGQPLWMSKNCGASNLRLTQATGGTSGWYCLFPCGINQLYEDIWMDNASTMIGSNNLGHSILRRIRGAFEAGLCDMSEWQNNNLIEDLYGDRFAANMNLNRMGVAYNNGADNIFRRVVANLDAWGRLSVFKVHRGRIEDCTVTSGGNVLTFGGPTTPSESILLGHGSNCVATGNTVVDSYLHGIHMIGEGHTVHNNRIHPVAVDGYSVFIRGSVATGTITDNTFGVIGAPVANDIIQQQFGTIPPAFTVSGNVGYEG